MPLESQLLRSIERRLRALAQADPSLQWRKRHGSPMSTAGDPDLYGLWHGVHWEMELKLPGADYLLHFAMPNFYFHLTTAYDILRGSGVEIGKRSFMGAVPNLVRV